MNTAIELTGQPVTQQTVHCTLCDWHARMNAGSALLEELDHDVVCISCQAGVEFLESCSCVSYCRRPSVSGVHLKFMAPAITIVKPFSVKTA